MQRGNCTPTLLLLSLELLFGAQFSSVACHPLERQSDSCELQTSNEGYGEGFEEEDHDARGFDSEVLELRTCYVFWETRILQSGGRQAPTRTQDPAFCIPTSDMYAPDPKSFHVLGTPTPKPSPHSPSTSNKRHHLRLHEAFQCPSAARSLDTHSS